MRIKLTPEQLAHAHAVAQYRQDTAERLRTKPRYGTEYADALKVHREGATGEKVVSVALGIPWDGNPGNFKASDVGPYQVRATRHLHGKLALHPRDTGIFILVRGPDAEGYHELSGWLDAEDGKLREFWWETARPAYFVPSHKLHAMDTLPTLV